MISYNAPAVVDATNGNTNCYMHQYTQSGNGVKALQESLIKCYKKAIDYDGVYGPGTASALYMVQGTLSITPDGLYGPVTRDHITFVWYPVGTAAPYCPK
jgi:peptidoglycan hydrolase-like protein with peptidoglycan-binding domain